MRKAVASTLLLAFAMAIPGSVERVQAKAQNLVRIATLAPRDTDLTRGFTRIDRGLRASTQDSWGIQLYPSGIAGDEKDVIRKMKIDQMDGAIVTSTGLSQIVPAVTVMNSPGVIDTYPELERVQKVMNAEWAQTFDKAGFKLIAWGEAGQLRYFSKAPVTKPADLKSMRPWIWPESSVMKETFKAIGATGVPLGVPDVYGALMQGMIDTVTASALAVVALQWHTKLKFVTNETNGVLVGGMIMTNKKWKSIPDDVRATLEAEIKKNTEGDAKNTRDNDKKAFDKLLQRGYTATNFTAEGKKAFKLTDSAVREHLTGRVYPKELLDRVMSVAKSGSAAAPAH